MGAFLHSAPHAVGVPKLIKWKKLNILILTATISTFQLFSMKLELILSLLEDVISQIPISSVTDITPWYFPSRISPSLKSSALAGSVASSLLQRFPNGQNASFAVFSSSFRPFETNIVETIICIIFGPTVLRCMADFMGWTPRQRQDSITYRTLCRFLNLPN